MILTDLFWGVLGLLLTVMVLSYLIGDNFFFRLAVHLFIGVTAGYLVVLIVNRILVPMLATPLLQGNWSERLWLLIPLVLIGLLILGQWRRFSAFGRLPLAFLAGLTAATVIGGAVFGTLIPQSRAIIEGFNQVSWVAAPEQSGSRILDAVVMLIGTVGTLSYFHFGKKIKPQTEAEKTERPYALQMMSKVGEVFIGISLGAVFAGIFSTALVALIERIGFVFQVIANLAGGG